VNVNPPATRSETPTVKTMVSMAYRLPLRSAKYSPVARIDGTHKPTKSPASLLGGPATPNQSATENRNDTKAAPKIQKVARLEHAHASL
jgi:hypothetical protein